MMENTLSIDTLRYLSLSFTNLPKIIERHRALGCEGTGGRNMGVKGVGSLWEAGEERLGSGILKVVGTGINRISFCNIA